MLVNIFSSYICNLSSWARSPRRSFQMITRTRNRLNHIVFTCFITCRQNQRVEWNTKTSFSTQAILYRGVTRNLLRGTKEEVWWTEVPSGVQGQSSGGGLGQSPQKPETNANFELRRGGTCTHVPMHPCPPWLHH